MTAPKDTAEAERMGYAEGLDPTPLNSGWPYSGDLDHPTPIVRAWTAGWTHGDRDRRYGSTPAWADPETDHARSDAEPGL